MQQQQQTYVHQSKGPAGTDQISIELYSKLKLTQDIRAQLTHHFTSKLRKPKNNRLLIIGAKVGIMIKLLEPYCSHIDAIAQEVNIPVLNALFVKGQSVEYTFKREGQIGEKHIVPKFVKTQCKINIINIAKFHDHIKRDFHYDIVLLQNIIVHPDINILKQLMRLRHDMLLTMIVPGKLVHKNLFQLLSGIQQNILHVFYEQVTHERVQYTRYITGRRQEINIWEIFVWSKKEVQDVKEQLKKVSTILEEEVKKNFVSAEQSAILKGPAVYESQQSINQYIDLHFGEHEYFGVKNFPLQCAERCIDSAKQQNIKGRALDLGCAVGRSTIQLAHYFDQVVGLQYSHAFVNAANNILKERYSEFASKVKFIQGDACNLDPSLGKFSLVFAGNLIDRVPHPAKFLRDISKFLQPHSLLILTSPYTWLQQYTKKQEWLGGKQQNGKDIYTYEKIRQILQEGGLKELKNSQDIRFVIQDNPWVYQYTSAQATYWIRGAK